MSFKLKRMAMRIICLLLFPLSLFAGLPAKDIFRIVNKGPDISADLHSLLLREFQTNLNALTHFFGEAATFPPISVEVFNSLESKALAQGTMSPAQANPEFRTIYIVQNESWNGASFHPENEIFVTALLGKSPLTCLEKGLALWFVHNWHEKGYLFWAKKLAISNNLPKLSDLLDNTRFEESSPLINGGTAAAFTAFLLDTRGKANLLQWYREPDLSALEALDEEFRQYLLDCFPDDASAKKSETLPYWKGFNFAHEGYQIYNGYGSELAKTSLQKLALTGSNAIAIVPYTFMRDPKLPTGFPIPKRAGSENDAAVIESGIQAKKTGLRTLLKPQIWLRNSWPGEINMTCEDDWDLFFDYYTKWVVHYALLAAIYRFDALCIGVEMVQSTKLKPDKWRQLIRKIRPLYGGYLTYAANWGEEFETIDFWDDLDYIGLDCYYPLSDQAAPSPGEIADAFRKICRTIENTSLRFNKPVLLTEIGFRSVNHPWIMPHAEADGRPFNEQHQQICYEAIFRQLPQKRWFKGILWWKWPSYLDYRGTKNTGFSPNNKAAETTVKQWFPLLPD